MKSNSKEIKLTGTSYALLALLKEFGDLTSYEIKQALESSIQNFWPVPHTTAYEEPARLAAAGYLSARQEEGGRRRRVYSLTEQGREALARRGAAPTRGRSRGGRRAQKGQRSRAQPRRSCATK